MNSIIFICPYFGKLPCYFDLVLKSCEYNRDIDWLIFTDDKTKYKYPKNVKVEYISFEDLKKEVEKSFKYNIFLGNPYKLCDYKPLYGKLFKKYIEHYDFWGHCDFDCIFGRLRLFLSEDILDKYDKIFYLGHMSLYKNNDKLNTVINNLIENNLLVRKILSSKKSYGFDEIISIKLLLENGVKIYLDEKDIADVYCLSKAFKLVKANIKQNENILKMSFSNEVDSKNRIFKYNKGILTSIYLNGSMIMEKEHIYVHFQKRNMLNKVITKDNFLMIPNSFIEYQNISSDFVKKQTRKNFFYKKFFEIKFKNLNRKLRIYFNK